MLNLCALNHVDTFGSNDNVIMNQSRSGILSNYAVIHQVNCRTSDGPLSEVLPISKWGLGFGSHPEGSKDA